MFVTFLLCLYVEHKLYLNHSNQGGSISPSASDNSSSSIQSQPQNQSLSLSLSSNVDVEDVSNSEFAKQHQQQDGKGMPERVVLQGRSKYMSICICILKWLLYSCRILCFLLTCLLLGGCWLQASGYRHFPPHGTFIMRGGLRDTINASLPNAWVPAILQSPPSGWKWEGVDTL